MDRNQMTSELITIHLHQISQWLNTRCYAMLSFVSMEVWNGRVFI